MVTIAILAAAAGALPGEEAHVCWLAKEAAESRKGAHTQADPRGDRSVPVAALQSE